VHELAIVGAGPAGLAAAYFVRDLNLDVTILEAGDEVGARTAPTAEARRVANLIRNAIGR
jgi:flavin-dependent dehydrogenase